MVLSASHSRLAGAKVLFVANRFHTNLFFATRALLNAGADVRVFAERTAPGAEDHRHLTPESFELPDDAQRFTQAIHAFAPDVCFVRASCGLASAAFAAGRFGRHPMFIYNQRPMSWTLPWEKAISRRLRGLTTRRVTPVRGTRTDRPDDPRSVYLPWPVGPYGPASPDPVRFEQSPLEILCVGKLAQPRKNQDRLIDALGRLADPASVRLTLVGSSDLLKKVGHTDHLRQLEDRAAAGAGGIPVRVHTDVPFAGMRAFYESHHLCILPSNEEPLGSAPVEAMVYGTVPVIERSCGSAGYLTDGVDGYRIDINDPDAIVGLVTRLAKDRTLLARMSAAARKTAETELSETRFLDRVTALLETP
ncbi:glycosyltransferase family 4 protein [Tropicimonas isoalkanivorans]|uniref:Glycosyltransferase involved in cell wall bisynthesis n=1 Tax=Tropicimonas isoalkanivorans TaxID=441112 RepID=A0A1I1E1T3_9RHOB|nr:glycosyltransferase family 4 protein [Tropicimonas isoalkanivorans]SFB81027.1 Glycosyltransferase involved in cell wall bisynthesis [Tropicimonas isoalkanivorans]